MQTLFLISSGARIGETLQTLVNGLTAENLDLKSRVSRVELENAEMMKRFDSALEKLGEIEKLVKAS